MWLAPAVVLVAALLRLAGTDWFTYGAGVVVVMFFAGLYIGFSEEVLTRAATRCACCVKPGTANEA